MKVVGDTSKGLEINWYINVLNIIIFIKNFHLLVNQSKIKIIYFSSNHANNNSQLNIPLNDDNLAKVNETKCYINLLLNI